ncbi:MAG: dicarboxylate/amino acid:cation symporter [Candidatus Lernaella stagnicola]|nr:dicarboxylate/amino acid:cation symporter [Candidatus Lernaella stagnicola]
MPVSQAAPWKSTPKKRPWLLPVLMLSGATLGFLVGGFGGPYWTQPGVAVAAAFVDLLGDLFIRLLKMVMVPIVVTSMILGIAAFGDVRKIGRTFGATLAYYISTTLISVSLGIVLVLIIRPGIGADTAADAVRTLPHSMPWYEALFDVFRDMVPANLFAAAAEGRVLGLIVASLIFGGLLTTLGSRGAKIIELVEIINEAIFKFVRIVIWLAPIGIFGLVAAKIGEAGGGAVVGHELAKLLRYALTVISGLMIHAVIILPLLLVFFARRNPLRQAGQFSEALLTAFTTASSAASLPITLRDARQNAGLSERTSGFVLPLGATINMDGTALYEAVAVIFICQAYGIDLSIPQIIVIWLTATLAAIGAAAIPEAGLVTMVMVLSAVGAPEEGIYIILSIDWFLDRCRTTVNVWGDTVGTAIIDRHFAPPPEA